MKETFLVVLLLVLNVCAKGAKEVQLELKARVLESQKTEQLDVVLVLDDSNSIDDNDFVRMQTAAMALVDSYSSASDLRIGVIKFSSKVEVLMHPTSRTEDAKHEIGAIQRERGDTMTKEALEKAQTIFQYYARENSRRVLFLITDGRPTSGDATAAANKLKFSMNVLLFTIGVGEVDAEVLKKLASQNHYFEMRNFQELLAAVSNIVEAESANNMEVVFQPFLQQIPLSFDQDVPLRIRISNIGTTQIPANCVLYFTSPTNYLVKHSLLIKEAIEPHSDINVFTNVPVSGSASPKTLPEYIDIEMTDPRGRRIRAQDSRMMMSSEYVIKSFENLKSVINILIFGCIGSGKTSWINAMLSALSPQVQNKGIVGDAGGHGTEDLVKFSLWEGIEGIPKIKINFWDTWGVTPNNYENSGLLPALLDGELPEGYHMKQRTPLNELKNISEPPQAFDGVLLFLPWDIMQQKDLSRKMHECFQVANKKGFNPLIIVTHIDKVDDESLRQTIKSEIAQMFRISENRVHMVQNYVREDSKNFQIDKKNLIILDEIIRISSGKASSRRPENKYLPYLVTGLCVLVGFLVVSFVVATGKAAPPVKQKKQPEQKKSSKSSPKPSPQIRRVEQAPEEPPSDKEEQLSDLEDKLKDASGDEITEAPQSGSEAEEEAELATTSDEESEDKEPNPNCKIVQVKVVSGASRQFRIGRTTTVQSLLIQAKKVFAGSDEKTEDYYLSDQKGAMYVEEDRAWNGSVFYMNKHTSA